ncbi:MAG: GNAT family N-acetyltransferase [Pseudomonadota bacterium]
MRITDAGLGDVQQMSDFLKELTASGKRRSPDDPEFVRRHYIEDAAKIRCSAARAGDEVLGFQSIKHAVPGNQWGVEQGWAIIGTHIRPSAARRGIGRALFAVNLAAAREASVTHIDASIAADNLEALAFYEAMGFRTYRTSDELISKVYAL